MDNEVKPRIRRWASSIVEFAFVVIGVGRPGLLRRLRETFLKRILKRILGEEPASPRFTWQPVTWVTLKLGALGALSSWILGFRAPLAALIARSVDFLKLAEAFAAKAGSATALPDSIAKWALIALVVIGIIPIALRLLSAAFTSVIACPEEGLLFAYRGYTLWRRLDTYRIEEIESVSLDQHAVQRLLGFGTLVVRLRSGAGFRLGGLWGAAGILRALTKS